MLLRFLKFRAKTTTQHELYPERNSVLIKPDHCWNCHIYTAMDLNTTVQSILTLMLSTTTGIEEHDHHNEDDHDEHTDHNSDAHGHSNDLHEGHIENTVPERIIMVFYFCCVSIFGFLFNFILITAILLTKKLRTAAGIVIVSVSSNDLFLCLFVYPLLVYGSLENRMEYSNGWCKFSAVSLEVCTYVRICTFPMVAYKRHRSLTRKTPDEGQRTLVFLMIVCWIVPMCVILAPLIAFDNIHTEYSKTYDACIIHNLLDYFSEVEFSFFLVCCIITCVFYIRIIKVLRFEVKANDRVQQPTMFQIQKRKIRSQFNCMMAFVSTGFFISVFPYLCFRMIDKNLSTFPYLVHKMSLVLLVSSSFFNPVTLIFTNKWHRLVIRNMICLKSPNKVIPSKVNIA